MEPSRARGVQLTDADRALLAFTAEHRFEQQRQGDLANMENLAQSVVVLQKQVNVSKSLVARASLEESR